MQKRSKRGETRRRIYTLLHRNPGLTCIEVHERLPDLTMPAVQCALNKMVRRKEAASYGKKTIYRDGMRARTCATYNIKYKSGLCNTLQQKVEAPKVKALKVEAPKVKALKVEAPKVKAPEVVNTFRPVVAPPSTFEPIPPVSDSFRKAYEHLAMINSETMLELHETKKALAEAEKAHDCWWCRLKKVFS